MPALSRSSRSVRRSLGLIAAGVLAGGALTQTGSP